MTNLDSILKNRDITLPTKAHLVKTMVFPVVIHVWVWELDHKESWVPDNWCFWTVVLEKSHESPLDCKEIQPVNSKDNQSWIFIGKTDVEAEAPIIWPLNVKKWLIEKDLDAGKDWSRRKGNDRRWDVWMASPTRWTWVWASSWRWWRTGKSGVLQFHGVAKCQTWMSDWTELNWTELIVKVLKFSPERHSKYY